jgi:hypothetical protein
MKTGLLVAACLAVTGCVTNYTRLRLVSSPPGAHVFIDEGAGKNGTSAYLGTAPSQPIVSRRFFLLQPREAVLRVRFCTDQDHGDVVQVRVRDAWKPTQDAAERATSYTSVMGFVGTRRCTTTPETTETKR